MTVQQFPPNRDRSNDKKPKRYGRDLEQSSTFNLHEQGSFYCVNQQDQGFLKTYGLMDPSLFNHYFYGCQNHFLVSSRRGFYYWPCANEGITGVCAKKDPSFIKGSKNPCLTCKNRKGTNLTPVHLQRHFQTTAWPDQGLVKITPLQPDGSVHFLLWQIGYPHWGKSDAPDKIDQITKMINDPQQGFFMDLPLLKNVEALCKTIRKAGWNYLKASGAYPGSMQIWLFFEQPLQLTKAVDLGKTLILKAILEEGLCDLSFFDKMVPSRFPKDKDSTGPAIELPLQGCALVMGRTYFLDDQNKNVPFEQSQQFLKAIAKAKLESVERFLHAHKKQLFSWLDPQSKMNVERKQHQILQLFEDPEDTTHFQASDVQGTLNMTLKNGIWIQKDNLKPRLIGQLLLLGSYWNPDEVRSKGRFFSGPRVIQHAQIEKGMIHLPRGMDEELIRRFEEAMIPYQIEDQTTIGQALDVRFLGELRPEQEVMVKSLLAHTHGILVAATGSGKTMMATALISQAKVSTLVIVNNLRILEGWVETLNTHLQFNNPEFEKNLKKKGQFQGKIGVLQANNQTLSKRVDIAMAPTLFAKKNVEEILEPYGMIIFDECHHAASARNIELLDQIAAKRVYGLTATPQRPDGLSPTLFWELGSILSEYSSKEQMKKQTFHRYFVTRDTNFMAIDQNQSDFMRISQEASYDPLRNLKIVADVLDALEQGRTVLVLTRYVQHARYLAKFVEKADPHVDLLLNVGTEDKEKIHERLEALKQKERVVLIGTYKGMGEGFDFPRLDTLMCTMPVDSSIVISQAIGRIHRQVQQKKDVYVYDYVDRNVSMFQRMFASRQKEYFDQGYQMNVMKENEQIKEKLPYRVKTYSMQPQVDAYGRIVDYRQQLAIDIRQAKRQISIVINQVDFETREELLSYFAPALARHVRVDLFLEECAKSTARKLEQAGMVIHVHSRIIGRFIVIDKHLSWYGPLGIHLHDTQALWQRVDDQLVANSLMEARRQEERAIMTMQTNYKQE